MCVLTAIWAVTGTITPSPPPANGPGLGVVLLTVAAALLVPMSAGVAKTVVASVMALAALSFAITPAGACRTARRAEKLFDRAPFGTTIDACARILG